MRPAMRFGSGSRLAPAPPLEGESNDEIQVNAHRPNYCGIPVSRQARSVPAARRACQFVSDTNKATGNRVSSLETEIAALATYPEPLSTSRIGLFCSASGKSIAVSPQRRGGTNGWLAPSVRSETNRGTTTSTHCSPRTRAKRDHLRALSPTTFRGTYSPRANRSG